MAILSVADYPAVRAAIDVSLGENNLPDSTIALPIFHAAAERWVRGRDPNAETYTPGSANAEAIKQSAIYACAALIIGANPNITSETFTDGYRYTRKEIDPSARQAELWSAAEGAVRDANPDPDPTSEPVPGPRSFMVRAPGGRGR